MLQHLNISEIQEMTAISSILAGGLAEGSQTLIGVPVEVAQALAEAREQMNNLPLLIDNLSQSGHRFATVSGALRRMMELAAEASVSEMEESFRQKLNEEFVGLAKVVAADAGRQLYAGPRLNLLNEGEAKSAAQILGYMNPVINTMEAELEEQKSLIQEVIGETVNFLNIITECYPEAEGALRLSSLVSEVAKSHLIATKVVGLLH